MLETWGNHQLASAATRTASYAPEFATDDCALSQNSTIAVTEDVSGDIT